MSTQLELFERPTKLTGEESWVVAKQVSTGELDYETAVKMVLSKVELDNDLRYIEDIVNQCTY